MDTLFPMPPKQKRPRGPRRQQEACKRCKHSVFDETGAYCIKFDLCIEFEDGIARLSKNNQPLTCDKQKWTY